MSTPEPSDKPAPREGGAGPLVGEVLGGRYLLERLIGEGGMGAVYQAEHTHMRKRLAVKILHPEMSRLPEVVARFEREAMAAAHIEHPNVAAATDFGKLEDGSFFLVLEYVEGRSLREAIAAGRLELGRACHVARQIASALARAHALGIVHRDLKPENVMLVTREGDPDFVKVLDFGIAKVPVGSLAGDSKVSGQTLTRLGMVYGTPEYMAPEQALGQEVDPRADLYALGVILFEMIAGERPYDHESKVTLLGMHVTAPVPKVSERAPDAGVPYELDALVARLMAKESSARFADARESIEALDAAAAHLQAAGRISGVGEPPQDPRPAPGRPGSAPELGPTRLAQLPASVAIPASLARTARAIASFAGAWLLRALKGRPPWLTPRVAALVVSAAAGLGIVVLSAGGHARGGATPAGSGRPAVRSATRSSNHETDDRVAGAAAKIDRGDFASAMDALAPIEKAAPDRADVHRLLEKAYTGVRDPRQAMREAGLWLDADETAAADPKLQEDVRNAALLYESQDAAFALLEDKMGSQGVDLLYDVAYGASGKQYPQAAARARRSLDVDEVRGRASPALAVLLDFRDARACDTKRALLDRARLEGDARMIPILKPYQATRGCGFLAYSDCYPCLHKDSALRDTIAAITGRAVAK